MEPTRPRVLTAEEINGHLARMSYKPGWVFRCYQGRWEGLHVVITTVVADAYKPGETTTLDVHSALPPVETTEELERWIAWRLGRIESHEMREFLKRDGRTIYNPHGTNADRDTA